MAEFGPYHIISELGRGAMAVVWRAYDPALEREVAIKEPLPPPGSSEHVTADFQRRFIREARAVARLSHPGIVTVHAAAVFDGRPGLVMELIHGRLLSDIVAHGRAPVPWTVAHISQLLEAVGYAHTMGVVHRDLKPDNVFVTADGGVKITDFGIAHVASTEEYTAVGTVLGTPAYMSPEQVRGLPIDKRTDLFSVGVIAYVLLTGTNPFKGAADTGIATTLYRIAHEDPPTPVELDPEIPSHLSETVMKALAKSADDRYADADAMLSDWELRSFEEVEYPPSIVPTHPPQAPHPMQDPTLGPGAGLTVATVDPRASADPLSVPTAPPPAPSYPPSSEGRAEPYPAPGPALQASPEVPAPPPPPEPTIIEMAEPTMLEYPEPVEPVIEPVAPPPHVESDPTPTPVTPPRSKKGRRVALAAAIAFVLIAGGTAAGVLRKPAAEEPRPEPVAVKEEPSPIVEEAPPAEPAEKRLTKVALTIAPTTLTEGGQVTLKAKLTSGGNGLRRQWIHFYSENSKGKIGDLGRHRTDSAGWATLKGWKVNSRGTFTIHAKFAGSDTFKKSATSKRLTVKARPVNRGSSGGGSSGGSTRGSSSGGSSGGSTGGGSNPFD
ncbi:MAG: serine/threonine-protein kinase [Coriobacteriia bacterium]|nr:serine/threonine-protein kinase [Coriobacteriia bacterium]